MPPRSLKLAKETLTVLDAVDLASVVGGMITLQMTQCHPWLEDPTVLLPGVAGPDTDIPTFCHCP